MELFACCHVNGSIQIKAQLSLEEHSGLFPINVAVVTLWVMLTITNEPATLINIAIHLDAASYSQLSK